MCTIIVKFKMLQMQVKEGTNNKGRVLRCKLALPQSCKEVTLLNDILIGVYAPFFQMNQ